MSQIEFSTTNPQRNSLTWGVFLIVLLPLLVATLLSYVPNAHASPGSDSQYIQTSLRNISVLLTASTLLLGTFQSGKLLVSISTFLLFAVLGTFVIAPWYASLTTRYSPQTYLQTSMMLRVYGASFAILGCNLVMPRWLPPGVLATGVPKLLKIAGYVFAAIMFAAIPAVLFTKANSPAVSMQFMLSLASGIGIALVYLASIRFAAAATCSWLGCLH